MWEIFFPFSLIPRVCNFFIPTLHRNCCHHYHNFLCCYYYNHYWEWLLSLQMPSSLLQSLYANVMTTVIFSTTINYHHYHYKLHNEHFYCYHHLMLSIVDCRKCWKANNMLLSLFLIIRPRNLFLFL